MINLLLTNSNTLPDLIVDTDGFRTRRHIVINTSNHLLIFKQDEDVPLVVSHSEVMKMTVSVFALEYLGGDTIERFYDSCLDFNINIEEEE